MEKYNKIFYKIRLTVLILFLIGIGFKCLYEYYRPIKFSLKNIDKIVIKNIYLTSELDQEVTIEITDRNKIQELLGFIDNKYLFAVDRTIEYSIYREYEIVVGDYILYIPSSTHDEHGYLKKNNYAIKINYPKEFIQSIEKILQQKYYELTHP